MIVLLAILLNITMIKGQELEYLENKEFPETESTNSDEDQEFDLAWQAHLGMTEIVNEIADKQKLLDFFDEEKKSLINEESAIKSRLDNLPAFVNDIANAKITHQKIPDHDLDDPNIKIDVMTAISLKMDLQVVQDKIKKKEQMMRSLAEEISKLHESKQKFSSVLLGTSKQNNRRLIAKIFDMHPDNLPSRQDSNFEKESEKRKLYLKHCGCSSNSGCNCHVENFYECLCTYGICCIDTEWAFCTGLTRVGYCLPSMY